MPGGLLPGEARLSPKQEVMVPPPVSPTERGPDPAEAHWECRRSPALLAVGLPDRGGCAPRRQSPAALRTGHAEGPQGGFLSVPPAFCTWLCMTHLSGTRGAAELAPRNPTSFLGGVSPFKSYLESRSDSVMHGGVRGRTDLPFPFPFL